MTNDQRSAPPAAIRQTDAFNDEALNWLNILLNRSNRADLSTLDAEQELAIRCVNALVSGKVVDLEFDARFPANERVLHCYFESRNQERVFGDQTLGIAYPVVSAQVAGRQLVAPLFVWQIQLEPDFLHVDRWRILRNDSHELRPNYPLFHLLDLHFQIDYTQRARALSEGRHISSADLSAFCADIRKLLGLSEEGLPMSVSPLLIDETGRQDGLHQPLLIWSAIFGVFPNLPRTTVTTPPVVAPYLEAEFDLKHTFTLMPLDPSQRNAFLTMNRRSLTVVEGASGSGKTHLIAAAIINALSNGKKCLVVSKNLASMRQAQQYLIDKGLGDLSFLLRHTGSDHLMLADMMRLRAEQKAKGKFYGELFENLLGRAKRIQSQMDGAWDKLNRPFFGDAGFSEVTGRFLRANRLAGKEMLLGQLNPADFIFSEEEFREALKAIEVSRPLFERFPMLDHPLAQLSDSVFLEYGEKEGREWARTRIEELLKEATQLHHKFIAGISDYSETLFDHYEQHYRDLASLIRQIQDGIADGKLHFGADFEKSASATEKIYGIFSERYKAIAEARERIGRLFETLRSAYGMRRYFEFDFPPATENRNIRRIADTLADFDIALQHWRKKIPESVREYARKLNARTMHAELDYREKMGLLEQELETYLTRFNESGLYKYPRKHEMLTAVKRQEFVEQLIKQLEESHFYLRDYSDFYVWQSHWLRLAPPAQKAVAALCKIKPENWAAAFESWYLYHLLQKEFHPDLIWTEADFTQYRRAVSELNEQLPLQIDDLWLKRKNLSLSALKSADSKAYKTWFGKDNRKLSAALKIEDLFRNHINVLTDMLPIMFVTPQVALDVVQSANMLYDMVFVDEGHNISKQECYHLFDLAKNMIVFGDARQDMTPMAEDDILEYCKGIGAEVVTLDYQHKESPEEWIRFNKIAFGTPFKRLPHRYAPPEATTVAYVDGYYDEKAQTNETEARQIIDWLNLIEPTPARTYPVVAIACATVAQRDLIAGQLLRIRQRKASGHEKIQQMQLNGLGVYTFSELQGRHVDVLLVSFTHGHIDGQGALTRDFYFWNSQLGINQLYVLLTRATRRVFIAHSIPPGLHEALASNRNLLGACILSHLVTFAQHLQNTNTESVERQLSEMKTLLNYNETHYSPSLFSSEVELLIKPYFAPGAIQRNAILCGLRTPFSVSDPDTGRHCVILTDGVLTNTTVASYEWELKIRDFLRRNKLAYYNVLSAEWWKSPVQEARRMAGRLFEGEKNNETPEEMSPESQT